MFRYAYLILSLGLLATLPAFAHSYNLGVIEIGHPWAPPSSGNEGAVYMVLATKGETPDRLIEASTKIADRAEWRDAEGHVVKGLDISPAHPFALRPKGRFLALVGLKHEIKLGESFPLSLRFQNAGTIEVSVMVERVPGE